MKTSFCGWYFKVQSEEYSLALIPAVHCSTMENTASLQILWDGKSGVIPMPACRSAMGWTKPRAILGDNLFCPHGVVLSVRDDHWSIRGMLRFGPLRPLRVPIMGPFALLPFLECSHRIGSMRHRVDGVLLVNGRRVRFENAEGYLEGDRGGLFHESMSGVSARFRKAY